MIIDNINLFGDISNIKQILFDTVHPIGETYVQYPQEDDPNTLYKQDAAISCEWIEVVKYNGCFFRSTNAPVTFYCREGETDYYRDVTLTKPIDVSGLGSVTVVSTTGGISTCRGSWTSGNANDYIDETGVLTKQNQATAKNGLTFNGTAGTVSVSGGNHRHRIYPDFGGSDSDWSGGGNRRVGWSEKYTEYSGNLSMSGSFTPSGTISGDTETRPNNYTVKVWKRIN